MEQPSRILFRALLQEKHMVSESFFKYGIDKVLGLFSLKLIPNRLNKFKVSINSNKNNNNNMFFNT